MAEKKKVVKRKGIKNVRKTKRRRARNLGEKKVLKLAMKAAREAIAANTETVIETLKKTVSVLDKAVTKGIIHLNKASRLKSRMFSAYNKTKKK